MSGEMPVLSVENLAVSFATRSGEARVLRDVSLEISEGESLGLVGESGCGKSTFALAIMRYLGDAGRITGGRIMFKGTDLVTASQRQLRDLRGRSISVVYQDPLSCLNPLMTIGRQLMEVPMLLGAGRDEAYQRSLDMLREVQLPDPARMIERYPHQLSGGQQQRIVIAMALIAEPSLLILDEPTTGLDVTVETAVLELLREVRKVRRTAMLYISHNFGTIVRLCDRVGVLYAGELVETGVVSRVFKAPAHPYTRGLLNCLPGAAKGGRRSPLFQIRGQIPSLFEQSVGCAFAERCHAALPAICQAKPIALSPVSEGSGHLVRCVRADELPPLPQVSAVEMVVGAPGNAGASIRMEGLRKLYERGWAFLKGRRAPVRALDRITISADPNHTVGIVGESGCGKSTLSRILSGLTVATEGQALVDDFDVSTIAIERRPKHIKRSIQMIFQNPDSTLNPSHTVGFSVRRTLQRLRGLTAREARRETDALLSLVKLPAGVAGRMPQQLSGGQKQRVAIARALAAQPKLIIADEPVSSLDVSVQAAILNLMNELQISHGTTYFFVSHDLAVVRHVADEVAIIYFGRVMESGRAGSIFAAPYHPYTEALIAAVPRLTSDPDQKPIILEGTLPNPTEPLQGCPFSSRCPRRIGDICDSVEPPEQKLGDDHRLFCHIPATELSKLQAYLPSF